MKTATPIEDSKKVADPQKDSSSSSPSPETESSATTDNDDYVGAEDLEEALLQRILKFFRAHPKEFEDAVHFIEGDTTCIFGINPKEFEDAVHFTGGDTTCNFRTSPAWAVFLAPILGVPRANIDLVLTRRSELTDGISEFMNGVVCIVEAQEKSE